MSYLKDPDRRTRGIGAIAARDRAPRTARAFGDSARGEGACYTYDQGAYYVNGQKVSDAEAKQYAACAVQPKPSSGGITPRAKGKLTGFATMAQLGPIPEQPTVPIGTRPRPPRPTPPPPPPTTTPPRQPPPSRPSDPSNPVVRPPRSGSGSGSGSSSSGTTTTTGTSTTGTATTTTTTTGHLTPSPSVTTTWITPSDKDAGIEVTSVVETAPAPSHKGLIALGVGIGLLYLLTRDRD